MTNYFDKQGNYINCENLSLAEIYHRAFALGVESTHIEGKRPQGEWIFTDDDYGFWHCNQCKAIGSPHNNFCPNCGADMVSKENTSEQINNSNL